MLPLGLNKLLIVLDQLAVHSAEFQSWQTIFGSTIFSFSDIPRKGGWSTNRNWFFLTVANTKLPSGAHCTDLARFSPLLRVFLRLPPLLHLSKLSVSFPFCPCGLWKVVRRAICVTFVEYLEAPVGLGVQEDKSNACQLRRHPAAAGPEQFSAWIIRQGLSSCSIGLLSAHEEILLI